MIRIFLICFTVLCALVIGVFGFRGEKFRDTPIQLFPDMDVTDKVKSQKPNNFFKDGVASRPRIAGTVVQREDKGGYSLEFGEGRNGYYYTGKFGDYFGGGIPSRLNLDESSVRSFLKRGKERYEIYCSVCHGSSGNGNGITSKYGIVGIANLHSPVYVEEVYPNGRLYDVITNGKGNMSGYGYNIPVRDRWAIVAYIRAIQDSKNVPITEISNAINNN